MKRCQLMFTGPCRPLDANTEVVVTRGEQRGQRARIETWTFDETWFDDDPLYYLRLDDGTRLPGLFHHHDVEVAR